MYTFTLMKAYLQTTTDYYMCTAAESLMGIRDTGKVPNRKVTKFQIVLILLDLILLILVK